MVNPTLTLTQAGRDLPRAAVGHAGRQSYFAAHGLRFQGLGV